MQSVIKKWGNSAAVRIPSAVLQAVHLQLDQAVDVRNESGRIIIEPLHPPEYELASLLDQITAENRHEAIETDPPVGQETW